MKIVNLPLLPYDYTVMEGVRVARQNRHSGLVATDGENFQLHRFDDLMNSLREDSSRTLRAMSGMTVQPIRALELDAGGLDLINPNDAIIEAYLQNLGQVARITSVADNPRWGRVASLFIAQNVLDYYVAVAPRSYKCSKGKEVIDEDALPADGRCILHKGGIFQ